jgi:predicted Zn-dependent protease
MNARRTLLPTPELRRALGVAGRWRAAVAALGVVAIAGIGVAAIAVALGPGCRVVQDASNALADATAGSAVSGVFRGTGLLAESMRDYAPSEEHYIGRAVAAQILTRYKVHPDASLQEYVNLVGQAVLAAPEAKRTLMGYRFVVLAGDEVQAVSAPGGFVFLTEGTVRKAKDEDELAAVLAHEVAHVSLNHGIGAIKAATRQKSIEYLAQGMAQGAGEYAAARGGSDAQWVAELADVFDDCVSDITDEILVKGYSRDTELLADAAAVGYLKSSGYARPALKSYLATLASAGMAGKGGWGATHPAPKDRIDELAALDLGPAAPPGRDVRQVRFLVATGG